ncbi:hypothetical protein AAY473_026010 [Plecturocebus cupreus]
MGSLEEFEQTKSHSVTQAGVQWHNLSSPQLQPPGFNTVTVPRVYNQRGQDGRCAWHFYDPTSEVTQHHSAITYWLCSHKDSKTNPSSSSSSSAHSSSCAMLRECKAGDINPHVLSFLHTYLKVSTVSSDLAYGNTNKDTALRLHRPSSTSPFFLHTPQVRRGLSQGHSGLIGNRKAPNTVPGLLPLPFRIQH